MPDNDRHGRSRTTRPRRASVPHRPTIFGPMATDQGSHKLVAQATRWPASKSTQRGSILTGHGDLHPPQDNRTAPQPRCPPPYRSAATHSVAASTRRLTGSLPAQENTLKQACPLLSGREARRRTGSVLEYMMRTAALPGRRLLPYRATGDRRRRLPRFWQVSNADELIRMGIAHWLACAICRRERWWCVTLAAVSRADRTVSAGFPVTALDGAAPESGGVRKYRYG